MYFFIILLLIQILYYKTVKGVKMSNIKELIGKRIKELRKEKALTQEEFAELIGIEPRNVINIENAKTFPRAQTLDKIISALEIDVENFFKFNHLSDVDFLRREINKKLKQDDRLTKFIYKILF